MKLVALAIVALVACANPEDYPQGGGGGGTGAGTSDGGVDATGDAGDAGNLIPGRVCVLTDLRQIGRLDRCEPTTAGGLTVFLGTRSTTTAMDGSFTIGAPQGAGFTWHVSGGLQELAVFRSAMPFGTNNTIPAIRADLYLELANKNGAVISDQEGSIIVRVVRGAVAVANVSAATPGATSEVSLYDTADADNWDLNQTGTFGVAWLPSVAVTVSPGTIPVALTQQGSTLATPNVSVEDQTITYITQDLL